MTEKSLRTTFLLGSLLFLVLLLAMTRDSLRQVRAGRTPAVTAQVAAGKQVWSRKNCNDCHTILGIGGYYAPDLTKIADVRDTAWLRRFLADPQAAKPGTTMPNQRLVEANVVGLVIFLDWVRRIDTNGWPPRPLAQLGSAGPARPTAPAAYQNKGCGGCHAVDGRGANGPGPDLSHLGTTPYDGLANDSATLTRFLADPAAVKRGTSMPKIPLTPAERDSVVGYLLALK
jgi:nitric oxide reductase subunit C